MTNHSYLNLSHPTDQWPCLSDQSSGLYPIHPDGVLFRPWIEKGSQLFQHPAKLCSWRIFLRTLIWNRLVEGLDHPLLFRRAWKCWLSLFHQPSGRFSFWPAKVEAPALVNIQPISCELFVQGQPMVQPQWLEFKQCQMPFTVTRLEKVILRVRLHQQD